MKEASPLLTTTPTQSMGLFALNAAVDTSNIESSLMLHKTNGLLPKSRLVTTIFIMSALKEMANNPTLSCNEALSNAGKELCINFALMEIFGPTVGIPLEIAASIGDRIDLNQLNQAVLAHLSVTSPENLPDSLREDLYLRNLEIMESCCLPYICKGISVAKHKLIAFEFRAFAKQCVHELCDYSKELSDTVIEAYASKLSEFVSQYGEPNQDAGEPSFKDILPAAVNLMRMYQGMAEASWFAEITDASSKTEAVPPNPDNAVELFKGMLATASEKIIEQCSNQKELTLADETVEKELASYQQLKSRLKPDETCEKSAKTILAEVLPDAIRIGAGIAEFVYRLNALKQEDKQFERKKSAIIRGMESTIKEFGFVLTESRKERYSHDPNLGLMSLPDLKHHIYSLMAEDITLELIGREKNFLAIQQQIQGINQHITNLATFQKSTGNTLQQVICEQIRIQHKIKDLAANKIPAEIQAGVQVLQKFAANCYPAVAAALEGASYLIALHNMNAQNKVENKLYAYQVRFQNYDSLANGLGNNLRQASYLTQHDLAAKTQLGFEQLRHAYGTPLLTQIRELTNEYGNDLSLGMATVAKLSSDKTKIEKELDQKGKELFNATGKKRTTLIDEITQLNASLSDNALLLLAAQKEVEDIQTTIGNLDKLYEQQKPITPLLDGFDKEHAQFYKGYTKEELEARALWQKTVKEQLCKIDALKADIDNAINGITTELLAIVPLLQGMKLNKTARYFATSVVALRNGYAIFRTGEKMAIAMRQLNKARFTQDGDTLTSTMSIFGAWKKMGLGFSIDKLVTPVLSLINLSAKLLDSVFGWNLFKDPHQEMRRLLAEQIKEGFDKVSDQLRQLSQQVGHGFGGVKREFIGSKLAHAENSNQHLVTQLTVENRHNENRVSQLYESKEKLSSQIESSIVNVVTKILRAKLKSMPLVKYYQSLAVGEVCNDSANSITLDDGVIINPLNAVQYIYSHLIKHDNSLSETQLPNYYLICSILEESISFMQDELSRKDSVLIKEIHDLGDNLYRFIDHLRTNKDWLRNLTQTIFADLQKSEQKINQRNPYKELTPGDTEIRRLNGQLFALELESQRETSLDRLTNDDQNDELYYWPNYKKHNKAAAPKTVKVDAVIITDLLTDNSVRVMYINKGKFVECNSFDDKNKFNRIIPLLPEEVELVKGIIKSKSREIGQYAKLPDQYKSLMDKLYAAEKGFGVQYRWLLKMIFRSQFTVPGKTCFELPLETLNPLLDKLSTQTYGNDSLAQTLRNIPVVLVPPLNKQHHSLLLPKALIDEADKHPNNKKLVEAANAGLIQINIQYIFEKQDESYFFSLFYSVKKDSSHKINNSIITVHRFDSAVVEPKYHSPAEFLIKALYGGYLIDKKDWTVYKINLFTFSAKYPTLGLSYDSRLFSKSLANALKNMIEHGIVTKAIKPFILAKHTNTQCDGWGVINLHLNTLRKERSLMLQNYLEQNSNEEKLSTILARATKNYELLIGSIRLFSTQDYVTTVALVKEILHLPHVKKMAVLLNTNIEVLQNLLHDANEQNKRSTSQIYDSLFEKVSTLTNDHNQYQYRLNILLKAIKIKLQTPRSDVVRPAQSVKLNNQRVEVEKVSNYRETLQDKARQSSVFEEELVTKGKPIPKVSDDIVTPDACNQFRAVARQLFIVNKEAFNKWAPSADQSFFKKTDLLLEIAQAVLRKQAVEFLRNNPANLSQDAIDAYLKEEHPGDEHTLTALAEVLKLTIVVADNNEPACFKLTTYPAGATINADLNKSIVLLQANDEINAAGTNLDENLTKALQRSSVKNNVSPRR